MKKKIKIPFTFDFVTFSNVVMINNSNGKLNKFLLKTKENSFSTSTPWLLPIKIIALCDYIMTCSNQ